MSTGTTPSSWAPPAPAHRSPTVAPTAPALHDARFRPVRIATDLPAARGRRVAAKALDLIAYSSAIAGMFLLMRFIGSYSLQFPSWPSPNTFLLVGALLTVPLHYRWVHNLATSGSSPGRRHLDLRVVRHETHQPLGIGRAAVRLVLDLVLHAAPLVIAALLLLTDLGDRRLAIALVVLLVVDGIDVVVALTDPAARTISDRIAGSLVVGRSVTTWTGPR